MCRNFATLLLWAQQTVVTAVARESAAVPGGSPPRSPPWRGRFDRERVYCMSTQAPAAPTTPELVDRYSVRSKIGYFPAEGGERNAFGDL